MMTERVFTVAVSAVWRQGFWSDQRRLLIAGYQAEAWADGRWTVICDSGTIRSGETSTWDAAMNAAERCITRLVLVATRAQAAA